MPPFVCVLADESRSGRQPVRFRRGSHAGAAVAGLVVGRDPEKVRLTEARNPLPLPKRVCEDCLYLSPPRASEMIRGRAITGCSRAIHLLVVLLLLPGMAGAIPFSGGGAASGRFRQEEEQSSHDVKQGQAKHCKYLNRRRTARLSLPVHLPASCSLTSASWLGPRLSAPCPTAFCRSDSEQGMRNGCGAPLLC